MTFPNISQNSTVMESPIGIEYFLLLTFPRLRDADTLSIQFSFDSLPLFGRPFSLLHDDKLDWQSVRSWLWGNEQQLRKAAKRDCQKVKLHAFLGHVLRGWSNSQDRKPKNRLKKIPITVSHWSKNWDKSWKDLNEPWKMADRRLPTDIGKALLCCDVWTHSALSFMGKRHGLDSIGLIFAFHFQ